ncbi:ABC transporter permease [Aliikangiella coralliicola]|uniref:ABC transporter permease n=1 Tax=Aliikangiella coralliicola TaxID=2592383 RepID=A0A545UGF9_9GAMM|nr:ABC transporter permease [Aliikangiella coralliicola]TQV88558.1 ABC transporter permease [Aliikangiella coralliicola]
MRRLMKDISFSFRTLTSRPIYSLIALLTLALGISVTATMFTLVNSILYKPLPMPESEQLMILSIENKTKSKKSTSFNLNIFHQMTKVDGVFESIAFWAYDQTTLTENNSSKPLYNLRVSEDYFRALGVQPIKGRWHTIDDKGKNNVLISYDLWRDEFQQSETILGRSILLDLKPHTIIGVMPPGFNSTGDLNIQVWNLLETLDRPGGLIARLKSDVNQETASQQLTPYNQVLNQVRQEKSEVWRLKLTSMVESLTKNYKPALVLLMLSVLAVFLIAVLNVVNLSFAQFGNRIQELAIRVSVGATRVRLVKQLLVENLMLSFAGGALGLLLAAWGLKLVKHLSPADLPRIHELAMDVEAVMVIVSLIVIAGVLTTLVPAFSLVHPKKLALVLKSAGRKMTGDKKSNRIRRSLVAIEVCVAVILLIATGLLLQNYISLLQQPPGFKSDNIIAGHVWLPEQFGSKRKEYLHWRSLINEIEKLPGVKAVAATTSLPMMPTGIDYDVNYSYTGMSESLPGEEPQAATRSITGNYFSTLQIPIIDGREFDERDTANSSKVVIINRALAERLWQEKSIIGRELVLPSWMGGTHHIVGVVENVKHRALSSEIKPEFYLPFAQRVYSGMSFIVQVDSQQTKILPRLLANTATSVDITAPMTNISSLHRLTVDSIAAEKLMLSILAIFASLALFLASIGVYGISDNMVNQRTNEIGIRMALGARPKTILRWILWESSRPVIAGAVLGLILVGFLGTIMSKILYGVSVWEPTIYLSVPATLVLVGIIAAWTPAKKATKIHPQEALHCE